MHRTRLFALALSVSLAPALHAQDTPIAKINGQPVLTEEQAAKDLVAPLYDPQTKIYDIKKNWIEQKTQELLFGMAAQKAGMSVQQWQAQEIDGKTPAVSQAEVDAFIQKFPEGRRPTAQQVTGYLMGQKRAERLKAVYDQLAKQEKLEVLLTPPTAPKMFGDADPQMGPANAPITLVEFTDFQCPYCRRSQDTLQEVEHKYAGKIRVVARQFPLSFHDRAKPSAEAALCAKEQGKFWEYRAKLFKLLSAKDLKAKAKELGLKTSDFNKCLDSRKYKGSTDPEVNGVPLYGGQGPEAILCAKDQGKATEFKTWLNDPQLQDADFHRYAQETGLDTGKFDKCYAEHRYAAQVDQDIREGQQLGVSGTPHFFINGRGFSGAQPLSSFQALIEPELAKTK